MIDSTEDDSLVVPLKASGPVTGGGVGRLITVLVGFVMSDEDEDDDLIPLVDVGIILSILEVLLEAITVVVAAMGDEVDGMASEKSKQSLLMIFEHHLTIC